MTFNPATSTETTQPTEVAPGDCILFATADWDTPYWTNKQHTADHLVKAGWRVLYVESIGLRAPRMRSGTDWRRILNRLWRGLRGPRRIKDGLWVLSPLVLPLLHHHPWVRGINQNILRFTISRFQGTHRFDHPLIWTYHPFVLEAVDWLRLGPWGTGKLVYHCVDDLTAIPGIDARGFDTEERRLLARADAVFTTSQVLYNKCKAVSSHVHDHPNVVDFVHFASAHHSGPLPPELASIPQPRLGYVGALSDFKVDFTLLQAVAKGHPEWHFVLIGDEREGQQDPVLAQMKSMPNVHHLGHRPYEMLPNYLRGFDLGLLPTRLNNYTSSMFPMKYFEYLAAGLRVAATPLDFTNHYHAAIETGADTSSFSSAITTQLGRGRLTIEESEAFVGPHTWTRRLKTMLRLIHTQ